MALALWSYVFVNKHVCIDRDWSCWWDQQIGIMQVVKKTHINDITTMLLWDPCCLECKAIWLWLVTTPPHACLIMRECCRCQWPMKTKLNSQAHRHHLRNILSYIDEVFMPQFDLRQWTTYESATWTELFSESRTCVSVYVCCYRKSSLLLHNGCAINTTIQVFQRHQLQTAYMSAVLSACVWCWRSWLLTFGQKIIQVFVSESSWPCLYSLAPRS